MVVRALIISFAIHFIVATAAYIYEPPEDQKDSDPILIDWISPKNAGTVSDPGILEQFKPSIDELKRKAALLSRRTIRVREQTKAQNLGYNANSPQANKRLNLKVSPKKRQQKSKISALANGDFSVGRRGQRDEVSVPLTIDARQLPSSYIHDLPPGVKPGTMTALNTDQHLYYSFFSRANERVYHRWVEEVGDTIRDMIRTQQKALRPKRYSTTLKIYLDEEGNYEETEIFKSCGIESIDRALQYAFKKARKIPHPPEGLIEDDGRVHLLYSVHVDYFPRQ